MLRPVSTARPESHCAELRLRRPRLVCIRAAECQRYAAGKYGEVEDREQDGVYLRLVELEPKLTDAPIRSARYRIAPRVIPYVAGQFSIPARLEGAAADARRTTVKFTLSATSDSATNRTYAEEAYFFVPMLLSDALRRAGEYVAALDWARTVYDYASPAGKQKIYYGLVAGGIAAGALQADRRLAPRPAGPACDRRNQAPDLHPVHAARRSFGCSWTSQTTSSHETPLKRFRGLARCTSRRSRS